MTQAPGAADGCPVDESFDPLSPDFLADLYAVMAALPREEQPIFFAPSIGYYVLTRYADIEQVLGDPAAYSAAVAQAPLVPGSGGLQPAGCVRRWPARLRPPPGFRQGLALLPGREPRQAGNSDRGRSTRRPISPPAAGDGAAAYLPSPHLVPGTAGPDGAHAIATLGRSPLLLPRHEAPAAVDDHALATAEAG
jgi:hypothetical protein